MENAEANQQLNDRGNTDLFPSSINQFINKLRERIPNIGLGLGVHIEDPNSRRSSSSRSRISTSRSSSGSSSVMNAISNIGSLFNRGRNSAPSIPSPTPSSRSQSSSFSRSDNSLGSNNRGQRPSPASIHRQSQFSLTNQSPVKGSVNPGIQNNGHLFDSGFMQSSSNAVNVNPIPQPVMQQQNVAHKSLFGFPQESVVNQKPIQPTFSLQQQQIQQHQMTGNQINSFSHQGRVQPQQVAINSMVQRPQQSSSMVLQPVSQQTQTLFGQPPQNVHSVNQNPLQLGGSQNVLMQQQTAPKSGTVVQPMSAQSVNTNSFHFLGNQQNTAVRRPVLPTPAPLMTQAIQTNGQTIINGAGGVFQAPQSVLQMSFNAHPTPTNTQVLKAQQNVGVAGPQVHGQFVGVQGQIFQLKPSSQHTYQVVNGQLVPVQQSFQLVPTGQTVAPRQQHQQQISIQNGQIQMAAFETNTASVIRKSQNSQPPTKVPFSFGLFSSNTNTKMSNLTSQAKQLVEQNAHIELQNQLLQQLLIEQVLNSHGVNATGSPASSNSSILTNSVAISNKGKESPASVAFNWREGTAVNASKTGIRRVIHGQRNPGGVKVISLRAANTVSPFNRSKTRVTNSPYQGGIARHSANMNIAVTNSPPSQATFDPEVLPQYRNSTNATLRSMDRTDRLNTTDIPEEIEVNGISLDSPADRNGVGTPHPLDNYVHGVHGHNNMGTRPVTPATAFGTRKNEKFSKLDRTDRLNTTDIPEEIEVNGQSLDSPADRNGMNVHHPMDYLVHGVTASGMGAHQAQASYVNNRPAPPPEEPEEMLFSASKPGYIDTTIGLGTNVMDTKHFRDYSLFQAVSHQAYDLMQLLQFSLSRIPSHVLHGVQYWMPNIPYNVFRSIKNSAPSFYRGFQDTVGSIPTSVARGILNLVDMIRHSSAKTTRPVKTVASKMAKVLHDSFTSPRPPTTQNLFDFRIFDMIQLTTTPALPASTPSPVQQSAKTLAKLMNLVKLLIHEPSTTTKAPLPAVNATLKSNAARVINTNEIKISHKNVSHATATKVTKTIVSKKAVSPKTTVKNAPKRLPPTPSQNKQQVIQKQSGKQHQVMRKQMERQNIKRARTQFQDRRLPPTPPQNGQEQHGPSFPGSRIRLPPTPAQDRPQVYRGNSVIPTQNVVGNARGQTFLNKVVQSQYQNFHLPKQTSKKQNYQQKQNNQQSFTITKNGMFEIQNNVPVKSKTRKNKKNLDLMGIKVISSKQKVPNNLPTQVPPNVYPIANNPLPSQVPPEVYRHERIATPPVYRHQPLATQPYTTKPPYQQAYPTLPRSQQPLTTIPSNFDYFQNNAQQNPPDYSYQSNFFGESVTQPTPTEPLGNNFDSNAESQNMARQPIENTIQYKEFSSANRKGFRISEVFGRRK